MKSLPFRRSRFVRLATLACFLCGAPLVSRAVILYRTADPAANTTAPAGDLAGSGWQFEGIFGGFLGTPIAPHAATGLALAGRAG